MVTYKEIFETDIKLWNWLKEEGNSDEKMWDYFYEFYKDPDGYPINDGQWRSRGDIKCTVDGLLSIKRIKFFEGIGDNFIKTFEHFRRTPIIFFPSERNGINSLRAKLLEDRIDHTLLDLKNYCESRGEGKCILDSAYQLPLTKKWIDSFNSDFSQIAEWLGVIDVFVENRSFEIFDLEKGDGSKLYQLKSEKDYLSPRNSDYFNAWSKEYYDNVKKKIEEYEKKK